MHQVIGIHAEQTAVGLIPPDNNGILIHKEFNGILQPDAQQIPGFLRDDDSAQAIKLTYDSERFKIAVHVNNLQFYPVSTDPHCAPQHAGGSGRFVPMQLKLAIPCNKTGKACVQLYVNEVAAHDQ
jgi:hypothetical protein